MGVSIITNIGMTRDFVRVGRRGLSWMKTAVPTSKKEKGGQMKIIDAPRPKSKAARFREIAREIAGKEKAAFFDKESDRANFAQIARKLGFKTKSKKLSGQGWEVWVI